MWQFLQPVSVSLLHTSTTAPRCGRPAQCASRSIIDLLDSDMDVLNAVEPSSQDSQANLSKPGQMECKDGSSSDSQQEDGDDLDDLDEDEGGDAPMPSPPPTVSKKRKRSQKGKSVGCFCPWVQLIKVSDNPVPPAPVVKSIT